MFNLFVSLLLLAAAVSARPPPSVSQHVLDEPDAGLSTKTVRKLQGKFLHITDIHPDPFYRSGSDPDGEHPCHAGEGRAGYFGAESTSCDSPISLINATFDWIKQHVKDDIDFVIWTGDSARHDNDERYPRSNKQVEQLNEFVVTKFDQVFGKPNNKGDHDPTNDFVVPIIPTFGNNDILPHNILQPGPNRWTRKYLTIWKKFIPQEQRHSFARGGWFFTEVIPNKLAVFSLNTLYFFESNGAVDGCYDPNDPGYEHFEWLRIQLQFLRDRGMKAILTGHVPPARTDSKQNWDESCYQKYNLWLRQYRDVIVGNVFGHMNIDHFVLHDVKELTYKFKIPGIEGKLRGQDLSPTGLLHTTAKTDYLSDLRDRWKDLPRPPPGMSNSAEGFDVGDRMDKKKMKYDQYIKEIGGPFAERFSLSVISPSVVPNFYPTLRIVEYNISGLEYDHPASAPKTPHYQDIYNSMEGGSSTTKKKKKKKPKKSKPNFVIPSPPSRTAAPGPAYSPQTLSWLSWRQLYANLTRINQEVAADHSKYAFANDTAQDDIAYMSTLKKHFDYELEYDTRDDRMYHLKDLTVRSWLSLAEKIGRAEYDALIETDAFLGNRGYEGIPAHDTAGIEEQSFGDESHNPDNDRHGELRSLREVKAANENIELIGQSQSEDEYSELKKHKKGKKRKGQILKKNRLWHAFLRRAFVGTKSDDQLEDEFG